MSEKKKIKRHTHATVTILWDEAALQNIFL